MHPVEVDLLKGNFNQLDEILKTAIKTDQFRSLETQVKELSEDNERKAPRSRAGRRDMMGLWTEPFAP